MAPGGKHRRWLVTIYPDYPEVDCQWSEFPDERIRYMRWQVEECPSSHRRHIQLYIELKSPQRMSFLRKALGFPNLHAEGARGSREECDNYCSKDESRVHGPYTLGVFENGGQGHRTDLQRVATRIIEGGSVPEVAMEFPVQYIKFNRGIRSLAAIRDQESSKKFRSVECFVHYGVAGSGKTRFAWETYSATGLFILDQPSNGTLWFDGYEGEDVILIDDFYGWIKWGMLLRLLDGYPVRLPIKGSHSWASWTKVIITSNDPPNTWYDRGLAPALARRITSITEHSCVDGEFVSEEVDISNFYLN